jgi:hypothetical protein
MGWEADPLGEPDPPKTTRYPRAFGKYQIVREAGRGGAGVVYEATDTVLQRGVALKVARGGTDADAEAAKKEAERFLVEARIGAHLPKHPHIVAVYEAGEIDGKQYLSCEFVRGESMARWRRKARVTVAQQVRLLRDVALAIEHAHQHGVIHRDLKPGNVLVDESGQPRITDFGLAKMTGQALDLARATPGHVWGTPAYMSPEHARGLDSVDHRSDIYSLGAMLYEILTGQSLFHGVSPDEAVKKVVHDPVPAPSSLSATPSAPIHRPLEALCMKALSKDPAHRPSSATAFADELTKWLEGGKGTVRRAAAEPKSRMPMLAAAGVAAVVVILGIVIAVRSASTRTAEDDRGQNEAEARGRERAEAERRQAVGQAASDARKEEAERGRKEQERLRQDLEARRRADEEEAAKQQALLLAQRQEAEERARKAEEELRKASVDPKPAPVPVPASVPVPVPPPTPAPLPAPAPPRNPAPGAPRNAPATPPTGEPKALADGVLHFEAEDYSGGDQAAEGRDYHDSTPGNANRLYRSHDVDTAMFSDGTIFVCMCDPGEWLGFRFEGEGRFEVEIRSAAFQNASAHLEVDGVNVTGTIGLPQTPNNTWGTVKAFTHRIPPGAHILRFVFGRSVNGLDWFRLKKIVPLPAPAPAALQAAGKSIRAMLKSEYARKSDLAGLAQKLLQEGIRLEPDPVNKYAMLEEARDVAGQAADVATALAAADEMDKWYAVDVAALKQESLVACGKSARTPEAQRSVAEAWLATAEQAAEREDFEAAAVLAGKGEPSARASQDGTLVAKIQSRSKELTAQRDEFRSVKAALKTLEEKPDDPAANLAAGIYRCFTRSDWARGLPMLAKGSEASLAALAQKELAGAEGAAAQQALGEAWHKAGDKRSGAMKNRHLSRAAYWYEKALAGMTGLERTKLDQQIEQIYKVIGGDLVRKGLVYWVEPGRDQVDPYRELVGGSRYTNNGAQTADAGSKVLAFGGSWVDYAGSDQIKAVERTGSMFVWVKNEAANAGLVHRGDMERNSVDLWFWIQGNSLQLGFNFPENPRRYTSRGTVPGYKWTFCGAVWDERNVTLYLDGKEDSVQPVGTNPIWAPRRSGKVRLGAYLPGSMEFRGQMGFTMIYNRPLPASEVQQLYAASRGRFR